MRDHGTLLRHSMAAAYMNGIIRGDAISFVGSFAVIGAYSRSLAALLSGGTICMHDYRTNGLRSLPEWMVAPSGWSPTASR